MPQNPKRDLSCFLGLIKREPSERPQLSNLHLLISTYLTPQHPAQPTKQGQIACCTVLPPRQQLSLPTEPSRQTQLLPTIMLCSSITTSNCSTRLSCCASAARPVLTQRLYPLARRPAALGKNPLLICTHRQTAVHNNSSNTAPCAAAAGPAPFASTACSTRNSNVTRTAAAAADACAGEPAEPSSSSGLFVKKVAGASFIYVCSQHSLSKAARHNPPPETTH